MAALRLMPSPPLIVLEQRVGLRCGFRSTALDLARDAAKHIRARQIRIEQPLQVDVAPQHAFVARVLDVLAVVFVRLILRSRAGEQVSPLRLWSCSWPPAFRAPDRFAARVSAARSSLLSVPATPTRFAAQLDQQVATPD